MNRLSRSAAKRINLAVPIGCLALSVVGCQSRRAEDFVPSADQSRVALEAALDTWRDGGSVVKPIASGDAEVGVEWVDNTHVLGRPLAEYRILGETPATNARAYVVELRLTEPDEKLKCRYVVVGIDPLWVFRQEDYDMLTHWDHAMPAEDGAAGTSEAADANGPDR